MKYTFTIQHVRYSHLILLVLGVPSILVAAQEACVKSCTKASGINECIGAIPHTEADWDVLETDTKSCYCVAAVNFSGCSPNCDISGFDPDTQGRVFGSWRYVDEVCADVVNQFKATASPNSPTTTTTSLAFSTIPAQLLNTEAPTASLDSVPSPSKSSKSLESSPSSSDTGRTIAISVTLTCFAVLAIGAGVWFWLRRRRQKRTEEGEEGEEDQKSAVVMGQDGFPVDQSGPNLVSPMRTEFKADTIQQWIEEQERIKQLGVRMEPDAHTETLSVGYTLWSETDLCLTEMGAEDAEDIEDARNARDRDMEPIKEEPGGEDEIRSTHATV